MTLMKSINALAWMSVLYAPLACSQCAPGVPSAGNPGCIPPDQTNSPYYQGSSNQPPAPQQAPQPRAVWADRWGSIATDAITGQAGTVEGQASKAKANQMALDICAVNGAQHCEVVLSFHNQCAAAAQKEGGGEISFVGSPTSDSAEQTAIDQCNERSKGSVCKIVYSKCSLAERIQ